MMMPDGTLHRFLPEELADTSTLEHPDRSITDETYP